MGEVEIRIKETSSGNVSVEIEGFNFVGSECVNYLDSIGDIVGLETVSRYAKDELFKERELERVRG